MAYNKQFYLDKLQAISLRKNQILQKYVNAGFDMVGEIQDSNEREKEVRDIIATNEKLEPVAVPIEIKKGDKK